MEPPAPSKSSPDGTQHFEWYHVTKSMVQLLVHIALALFVYAKMPCSKLVPRWALIRVNFDPIQQTMPKVGGGCSFMSGHTLQVYNNLYAKNYQSNVWIKHYIGTFVLKSSLIFYGIQVKFSGDASFTRLGAKSYICWWGSWGHVPWTQTSNQIRHQIGRDLLRRTNGSQHCLSDLRRGNTALSIISSFPSRIL